jgi:signal peptide peptidase SppA
MRFQKIREEVFFKPWLITASGHQTIVDLLNKKFQVLATDQKCDDWKPKRDGDDDEDGEDEESIFVSVRPSMSVDPNSIAHIYIMGVLGRKMSLIEKSCGNTDYLDIQREIERAQEYGARGIMFHIDSPGGTVTGNSELVEIVQQIDIPKIAYVDAEACSAAYNLACSTDAIYSTQSGIIGSIGTLIPWVDKSKMWGEEGMAWDPITNEAGDLKAAGHGPSLTPEQRSSLQELVEDAFEDFKGNVLRNRRVPLTAMRGQAFYAKRALENNLIDAIASESEAYAALMGAIPI